MVVHVADVRHAQARVPDVEAHVVGDPQAHEAEALDGPVVRGQAEALAEEVAREALQLLEAARGGRRQGGRHAALRWSLSFRNSTFSTPRLWKPSSQARSFSRSGLRAARALSASSWGSSAAFSQRLTSSCISIATSRIAPLTS